MIDSKQSRIVSIALLLISISMSISAQSLKVLLDADTGNEVDDLFAISRALIATEFETV